MAFVITQPCLGCLDASCVEVCPVDCIHGLLPVDEIRQIQLDGDEAQLANMQLFIDPQICIDCGACEPECPVEAIFEEYDVPDEWEEYIDLNAKFFES